MQLPISSPSRKTGALGSDGSEGDGDEGSLATARPVATDSERPVATAGTVTIGEIGGDSKTTAELVESDTDSAGFETGPANVENDLPATRTIPHASRAMPHRSSPHRSRIEFPSCDKDSTASKTAQQKSSHVLGNSILHRRESKPYASRAPPPASQASVEKNHASVENDSASVQSGSASVDNRHPLVSRTTPQQLKTAPSSVKNGSPR